MFSGFRGTGKSTELRRLAAELKGSGEYVVVACDMRDYVNQTLPIDVSDFLVSLAAALSDALEADSLLGKDPLRESYDKRFWNFLKRISVSVDGNVKITEQVSVGLKLSLRDDPSFRSKIQDKLKGHIVSLLADVRQFVEECRKALVNKFGDDYQVVLVFDSLEQIRGTSVNEQQVFASVENLFHGHANALHFDDLHVVYTVPPWLRIKAPGIGTLLDTVSAIHCVKVVTRNDPSLRDDAGIASLCDLVTRRGDWKLFLRDRGDLERLVVSSGGYIRDHSQNGGPRACSGKQQTWCP